MSARTVLITGASSGLGEEMARQFAARGYNLALCARRLDRLETLRHDLRQVHPGIDVGIAALDVTDDEAVRRIVQQFAHDFGAIDRVIVNAGVGSGAALGTGGAQANRATAMTNFVGALSTADAALEVFRAQGRGHLVFISSISALRGMPKSMTTYAATKAGVAAIAEGLRAEQIPGVAVSVIYPGYIRTEMNVHVAERIRFMVDTVAGTRAIVAAIEREARSAYVPRWPWSLIGVALRRLPSTVVRRLM